jgi:hypothetical protein
VANLRRNPIVTVLVDRNVRFPELQGVMMQGTARILEDADAEAAEPGLDEVRRIFGRKYAGGHGEATAEPAPFTATARGRTMRWVVVSPTHTVSWDNHKLGL